jgi:hypothetical protein
MTALAISLAVPGGDRGLVVPANLLGFRHIAFVVHDLDEILDGLRDRVSWTPPARSRTARTPSCSSTAETLGGLIEQFDSAATAWPASGYGRRPGYGPCGWGAVGSARDGSRAPIVARR